MTDIQFNTQSKGESSKVKKKTDTFSIQMFKLLESKRNDPKSECTVIGGSPK